MTELPETLANYRMPWPRDRRMRADLALRRSRGNTALLIGLAAVGIAGFLAWRNREQLATRARPVIERAKVRGQGLIEDAKIKGQGLVDEAKSRTRALGEKVASARRTASEKVEPKLN